MEEEEEIRGMFPELAVGEEEEEGGCENRIHFFVVDGNADTAYMRRVEGVEDYSEHERKSDNGKFPPREKHFAAEEEEN